MPFFVELVDIAAEAVEQQESTDTVFKPGESNSDTLSFVNAFLDVWCMETSM